MDIDDLFQDPCVQDCSDPPPQDHSCSASSLQVLSRLDAEEESVYVLSGREGGGLRLTVCAGAQTWTTLLTAAKISSMAALVDMDAEDFLQETERALTRQPLSTENFVYNVCHEAEGLCVAWKRHLLADDVKFQLGCVVLKQEQASPVLKSILDHAVSSTHSLQDRITQLEKDNLRLVCERKAALERLEQCTSFKEQLEREMYSKFKVVLNEKKGKIRQLLEEASHQSTPPSVEATGPDSDTKQCRPQTDQPNDVPSHHTAASPRSLSAGLLGEVQEVVSPVKRRKREPQQRGARVPDIPHPPSITRPHCGKVKVQTQVSHRSSSAEGDDLLQLL